LKQIKGKAREDCGKLTGNKSQEIRGKAELAAGKAQNNTVKLKEISKKPSQTNRGQCSIRRLQKTGKGVNMRTLGGALIAVLGALIGVAGFSLFNRQIYDCAGA